MNEDSFFIAETFENIDDISAFLAHFGRDLVSWSHVVEPRSQYQHSRHHVVARFTAVYGYIEDDAYIPYED